MRLTLSYGLSAGLARCSSIIATAMYQSLSDLIIPSPTLLSGELGRR